MCLVSCLSELLFTPPRPQSSSMWWSSCLGYDSLRLYLLTLLFAGCAHISVASHRASSVLAVPLPPFITFLSTCTPVPPFPPRPAATPFIEASRFLFIFTATPVYTFGGSSPPPLPFSNRHAHRLAQQVAPGGLSPFMYSSRQQRALARRHRNCALLTPALDISPLARALRENWTVRRALALESLFNEEVPSVLLFLTFTV